MSAPLPPESAYEALARQAYALALLLRDRGRLHRTAWRKAHDALRFSATTSAPSLAVPTKLVGVRPLQATLAALRTLQPPFGLRLDVVPEDVPESVPSGGRSGPRPGVARARRSARRLVVRIAPTDAAGPLAGATLGFVQCKHVPWLVDLLPLGVEIRLSSVTGGGDRGLLGCNVHLVGVGAALARLARYGAAPEAPPVHLLSPPSDPSSGRRAA